jgi:hypothetical protein
LTARFIATVLLTEPYKSTLSHKGLRIVGARFHDPLDLSHAELDRDLSMTDSDFESDIDFSELHTTGSLLLEKSFIAGHLNLQGVRTERSLDMSCIDISGDKSDAIRLDRATIKGDLALWEAHIDGGVNMDSLSVGGHLFLGGRQGIHSSFLGGIWLQNASIGGAVYLADAKVAGELMLRHISTGNSLLMYASSFDRIDLRGARIGGDLAIEGPKERERQGARRSVDLSASSVSGALSLGSSYYGPLNWPDGAALNLRNAQVFELRDGIECKTESNCNGQWPSQLELDGFTYQQLDAGEEGVNMAARGSMWWSSWLARQTQYSPYPYEQLASLLQKIGYKEKANDILYEGKRREGEAATYPAKLWMKLQWALTGYGYRLNWAWWWVLGCVALGASVLRLSGEGPRHGLPYGIAYSIDMLLPIVKLRDMHYAIELNGWARYYFYAHKIMGFVLGSFVLAALAGLTK